MTAAALRLWALSAEITVGPSWCVTRFADGAEVHAPDPQQRAEQLDRIIGR